MAEETEPELTKVLVRRSKAEERISEELQKAESALNKLRRNHHSKEHTLLLLIRDLANRQHRAAQRRQLVQDLKELRSGKLLLSSGGACRLWEGWVLPEFMPQNITELRRVTARLEEFYGNILLAGDEPP